MAISGIVVTLSRQEAARESALEVLATDSRVTLGDCCEFKLPAVLDTKSKHEYRECWDRIASLPGVVQVDLVCVHYDDHFKVTHSQEGKRT